MIEAACLPHTYRLYHLVVISSCMMLISCHMNNTVTAFLCSVMLNTKLLCAWPSHATFFFCVCVFFFSTWGVDLICI